MNPSAAMPAKPLVLTLPALTDRTRTAPHQLTIPWPNLGLSQRTLCEQSTAASAIRGKFPNHDDNTLAQLARWLCQLLPVLASYGCVNLLRGLQISWHLLRLSICRQRGKNSISVQSSKIYIRLIITVRFTRLASPNKRPI